LVISFISVPGAKVKKKTRFAHDGNSRRRQTAPPALSAPLRPRKFASASLGRAAEALVRAALTLCVARGPGEFAPTRYTRWPHTRFRGYATRCFADVTRLGFPGLYGGPDLRVVPCVGREGTL